MIVVMKSGSTRAQREAVVKHVEELGLSAHTIEGEERSVVAVVGRTYPELMSMLSVHDGVDEVVPISKPYKLSSREVNPDDTIVEVRGVRIGGGQPVIMAGPCSVENEEMLIQTARAVKAAGAHVLRGGAYKPRTSPYAFQGLGEEGLRLLQEAKDATGLPIVTELMDARDLEAVLEVADVIQVGARNMQNYTLLTEIGRSGCPALIKRGLSATLEELLMAAEYVLKEGNEKVMLCERGIRTFEKAYRYTLDLTAVPVLKELSHLPVIVDPSHAAGRRDLVEPLSLAAAAVGADGIIVEVHPDPENAICDGPQALRTEGFAQYTAKVEQAAALSALPASAQVA